MVSGFSYFVVRDVGSIGSSHAIISGPSTGPQNILLMGLESRTDWDGNILPNNILKALHSGSRQAVENGTGGNDTNTLILIHIPAGGKKAVGFSIPRDDWVNFAGTVGPEQHGKIDQAYGVSMYYEQQKLRQQNPGMSQDQLAFQGNEAGRTAAVDTVEQLTGVHIDHFAEVNMDGFYELAKVLGGVEVCLNHAVDDPYSGAHFRAGYQHLDARQALAFVRQRHGLPNGDLDRTHRQQAFLDSVMHQLRADGVLDDLTKLQALLSVAKQYVITDAGWNLLDFAAEMRDLTSSHLVFRTLPIEGYATIDGQDANEVSPAYIKALVSETFYPRPGPEGPGQRDSASSADDGGRPQRRRDHRPCRACLGRSRHRGIPGRQSRQHECSADHSSLVRRRRSIECQQDRQIVRHRSRREPVGCGRPRRDPARRERHLASRPGPGQGADTGCRHSRRVPARRAARSARRTAFPA